MASLKGYSEAISNAFDEARRFRSKDKDIKKVDTDSDRQDHIDPNRDSNVDSNTKAHTDSHTRSTKDSTPDINPDLNIDSNTVSDTKAHTDSHTRSTKDSNTDINTDINTDLNTNSNTKAHTDSHARSIKDSNTDINTDLNTNSNTKAHTDSHTRSTKDSTPDLNTDSSTVSDTKAHINTHIHSTKDSNTDLNTNSNIDSDTSFTIDPDIDAKTDTHMESNTNINKDSGTEIHTDYNIDLDTDSNTNKPLTPHIYSVKNYNTDIIDPDSNIDSSIDLSQDYNIDFNKDLHTDSNTKDYSNYSIDSDINNNIDSTTNYNTQDIETISIQKSNEESVGKPIQKSIGQSIDQTDQIEEILLTSKQHLVYQWFLKKGEKGAFNRSIIANDTKINKLTVKSIIQKFIKFKILTLSKLCPVSKMQRYSMNLNAKVIPIDKVHIDVHTDHNTNNNTNSTTYSTTQQPINSNPYHPVEYHMDYNTDYIQTTTSMNPHTSYADIGLIEQELQINKDLRYWRHKNLNPQKVATWMTLARIPFEDMIESLAHCAFYLIESKERDIQGRNIDNVFAWFWNHISKYGYYGRPNNFKSQKDLEIERAKQRVSVKQAELAELENIEKQMDELKESVSFQKWWQSLSEKEQNAIDLKSQFKQKQDLKAHRKMYWKQKVENK